ncbi:MAG: SseB family protein [Bdellovibrionota bacterium]
MSLSEIELLLEKSFDGSESAAEEFFILFLNSRLIVPSRYQKLPLSNAPEYPNDFTTALGVKELESTFIPVFIHQEQIFEWCGQELESREIDSKSLLQLVPEGWWIVLNPGSEFEKEFSPWEIEKLKLGEGSIPEILADIFEANKDSGIEIESTDSTEFLELKNKLSEIAKRNPEIKKIGCIYERGLDDKRLLFAVSIANEGLNNHLLRQEISSTIEQGLIGSSKSRIIFDSESSPALAAKHLNSEHFFYVKESFKGTLSTAFKQLKKIIK